MGFGFHLWPDAGRMAHGSDFLARNILCESACWDRGNDRVISVLPLLATEEYEAPHRLGRRRHIDWLHCSAAGSFEPGDRLWLDFHASRSASRVVGRDAWRVPVCGIPIARAFNSAGAVPRADYQHVLDRRLPARNGDVWNDHLSTALHAGRDGCDGHAIG